VVRPSLVTRKSGRAEKPDDPTKRWTRCGDLTFPGYHTLPPAADSDRELIEPKIRMGRQQSGPNASRTHLLVTPCTHRSRNARPATAVLRSRSRHGLSALALVVLLAPSASGQPTANWISQVFRHRPETRLVDLVLPGTHDAGSYAINGKSKAAPGSPKLYTRFGTLAAGWARTQEQDLEHQLLGGIRYMDLRIAKVDDRLVLVHGLVSCPLRGALQGMQRFARSHPREVVILDMQAMPGSTSHDALDQLLVGVLGRHMVEIEGKIGSWTLARIWRSKRNLIILSRNRKFARRRAAYRGRDDLDSVWTDARDLKSLKTRLDARIRARNRNRLQCAYLTFTPDAKTVVTGPLVGTGTLRAMSQPLFRLPGKWIPGWVEAGLHPNVVAVDFYDRTDLVATVIAVNRRRAR